ncbi:MAG: hypothetical protein ACYC6L_06430 [Anaerolineae bacterium]
MASKKPVIDEAARRKAIDEIVHGTFLTEGTMVAFPTCFPGVTTAIPADESLFTALTLGPDALVYGCTSGKLSHLAVGMFHGLTGIIYDLGTVDGMTEGVAVGCNEEQVIAAFNGPAGGCLVHRKVQGLPFDLLQEWGFGKPALEVLPEVAGGERIIDGVMLDKDTFMVATDKHLAAINMATFTSSIVATLPQATRLARTTDGQVLGVAGQRMWSYSASRGYQADAFGLPSGNWDGLLWQRTQDLSSGVLYLADADGKLYTFDTAQGLSACLATIPLTPVGAMAATFDGRLFGSCGEGIANLFCYEPADKSMFNLGVAASVIERRRYGYTFGAAIVGRDGEIVFGENDNLGHIWLYFPRLKKHG